jgi:hypothetical protein
VINNCLQLHRICLGFEGLIITYRRTFDFWIWIYIMSIATWIFGKLDSSLKPSITCNKLSPSTHQTWFLKILFTSCTNLCNTKWIVNFPIVKSWLHCKYLVVCASLYNEHATLMFVGTTHLYLVSFFLLHLMFQFLY